MKQVILLLYGHWWVITSRDSVKPQPLRISNLTNVFIFAFVYFGARKSFKCYIAS